MSNQKLNRVCPTCKGAKTLEPDRVCTTCKGRGTVEDAAKLTGDESGGSLPYLYGVPPQED